MTWNARALCHHKITKANKKQFFLRKAARNTMIIALQEVHGTREEVVKHFRRDARDYHIVSSPSSTRSAGGVVTMIHKSYSQDYAKL